MNVLGIDIVDAVIEDVVQPDIKTYYDSLNKIMQTVNAHRIPFGENFFSISYGRTEYNIRFYVVQEEPGLIIVVRDPRNIPDHQYAKDPSQYNLYLRYINVPQEQQENITQALTPK